MQLLESFGTGGSPEADKGLPVHDPFSETSGYIPKFKPTKNAVLSMHRAAEPISVPSHAGGELRQRKGLYGLWDGVSTLLVKRFRET